MTLEVTIRVKEIDSTHLYPPGHSVQTDEPFLLYVPFSHGCSPCEANGQKFPAVQSLHSICPTVSVYVPLKHGKGLAKGTSGHRNPLSHCEQLVWPAGAYSPGLHLTGLIVWLEHLSTTEQCE